jgi:hypothetical protein
MRGILRFGALGALCALGAGAACGNVTDQPIDAAMPDAPPPATVDRWVVNNVIVPKSNTEARTLGLDLNSDGIVDNQFGAVIAALNSQGVNLQASFDTAIAHGTILMLGEASLGGAGGPTAATFTTYTGANPRPAPCSGATDVTCRHHLDGTGVFDLAPTSAHGPPLAGTISNGTLVAGPGHLQVTMLAGTIPVVLDLLGARVRLQMVGGASLGQSILAGAISLDQRDARIYPALEDSIKLAVQADCSTTTPPDCGCAAGSLGKTYLGLFDTSPKDCVVSLDEIRNNTLIQALLAPDVNVEGQAALSVGFAITAVKGTFTP